MQDSEYNQMVAALAKNGEAIQAGLTPWKCQLLHAGLGVASEGGELADAIKAHVIYGKPLDRANVVEELGDLEFFQEHLRALCGLTREEVLVANRAKLAARYAGLSYSDTAAIARADKAVAPANVPEPGSIIPAPVPEKRIVGSTRLESLSVRPEDNMATRPPGPADHEYTSAGDEQS